MSQSSAPRPASFVLNRRQFGALLVGGAAAIAVGSNAAAAGTAALLPSIAPAAAQTSFGTVAIGQAKRIARFGRGNFAVASGPDPLGHGHGPAPADPSRAPANLTWADIVVLWLAVRNSGGGPVHLSPGQLRLQIIAGGTSVTPRNFGTPRLVVPPGAATGTWVSYLAPASVGAAFLAEFTDPALDEPLTLPLPVALAVAEARNAAEPWAA